MKDYSSFEYWIAGKQLLWVAGVLAAVSVYSEIANLETSNPWFFIAILFYAGHINIQRSKV